MREKFLNPKVSILFMKNLNFLIILFITSVMAYSLEGFTGGGLGLDFIEQVNSLPIAPWKLPIVSLSLYLSCLCLMSVKTFSSPAGMVAKFTAETALIFLVSYFINFSYMGLYLLLLADFMAYVPSSKWRYSYMVVFCVFYILIEYLILHLDANLITFETYLGYFQLKSRLWIMGVKDVLTALNLLLFLVFVSVSVRLQYNEKERILSLNEQLNMANAELKNVNTQLEEYSDELIKMAETEERNRFAREIHDTLGHSLTGIITGLEACIALIDVAPEATKIQLKSIIEVATQGMTDVRRSVRALRPDRLEKDNLENALVNSFQEMCRATNVKINYSFLTDLDSFTNDEEDLIYRVIQESITNSIRHGRATQIDILVAREENTLVIEVKDNGIGCPDKVKKGFGLHHMQERLEMLNGKLSYNGKKGFWLKASFPIRIRQEI